MTEKPYTDADVKQLAAMVRARIGWPISAGEAGTIVTVVLQELAVVGRLAATDDDPRHIIEFRPDGWTIKHPLSCRLGDLFGCPVNQAAEDLNGPPAPPGRYEVTVDGIDGRLRVGERVDQEATPPEDDPADAEADQVAVQNLLDDATRAFADAGTSSERVEVIRDLLAGWYAAWPASAITDEHEGIAHQLVALVYAAEARAAACPCLPGAPEHRHGVGGYSTTPTPEHHVITFAADGTWSLTHPDTCPDFPDCQVRRLALRQITPDLAALVAGGRYECEAANLGDLFQLIDRLHDNQCTPPPCTACGCWCHAEDQTEG